MCRTACMVSSLRRWVLQQNRARSALEQSFRSANWFFWASRILGGLLAVLVGPFETYCQYKGFKQYAYFQKVLVLKQTF